MDSERYIPRMAIKWRLREVLDEHHITPLELARRLGVKHPTIYRMVARKRFTRISEPMLDKLCKAIGCQPGDLMQR